MNQNEHILIASIILIIIYQFIWHLFLKRHPIMKKNIQEWEKIIKKLFYRS